MHLCKRQFKMPVGRDGSSHHLHSLFVGSSMPVCLMRRIAGWHEQDLLQSELLPGTLSEDQMADMDRIKGAAHDPYFSSHHI